MHEEFVVTVPDLPEECGVSAFNRHVAELCQRIRQTEAALATLADDAEDVEFSELQKRTASLRTSLQSDHRQLLVAAINRGLLLKQLEKPLRAAMEAAEASLDKARQRIGKALEKAGCGVMDQPGADRNPVAARARFTHQVETSSDVRQAREAADQAAQNLNLWARVTRESPGVIVRQRDRLKALTRQLLMV